MVVKGLRDIIEIIRSVKASKAAGIDDIPARLVKDGAEELVAPLTIMINRSLECGLFPTQEKCAKITPIYKSDSKSNLDNYRPISVLTIISKIVEKVVYLQRSSYLEVNKMLSENQYGFRQKRSTNHAVTRLVDDMRLSIDKGAVTGAVFLDLRKVFDSVQHACLLQKLPCYGILHQELHWFEDYLFNRTQIVNFDGVNSDLQAITYGVPQGSILGPLLFSILVNDLETVLERAEVLFYADDTVLYFAHRDPVIIECVLNNETNKIANGLSENHLYLNLKKGKTEFVMYGTAKNAYQSYKTST